MTDNRPDFPQCAGSVTSPLRAGSSPRQCGRQAKPGRLYCSNHDHVSLALGREQAEAVWSALVQRQLAAEAGGSHRHAHTLKTVREALEAAMKEADL